MHSNHLYLLLYNFREDQRIIERYPSSTEKSDLLQESQQDVRQDDCVYSNIDDVEHYVYKMPNKPGSENVLEHSGHPELSTAQTFPSQTSQMSRNPACHITHGAGASATKKSSMNSKLASAFATESVDSVIY